MSLPPDKVSQGQDIPIADVLARMKTVKQLAALTNSCRVFLPTKHFSLWNVPTSRPRQQTQLYQHALERLDKALAIRSDHGHTYQEKAYIYSRLHNYEQGSCCF